MIEQKIHIKSIEHNKIEQAERINLLCLPENYSRMFYLDLHHRFPKTFLVALINNTIVGYIMCRIETGFSKLKRLSLSKRGHIVSIAVLEQYQNKGIGKDLLLKALKGIMDYGASESFLEVRASNKSAIKLYQNQGFKIKKKIIGYYRNGEDALLMASKL